MHATKRRLPIYIAGGAGVSALAVALGLTLGSSGSSGAAVTSTPPSTVVMTRNTDLGRILVDAQGRTLYLFAKDTGATSTCDGSCASYWPPVPVTGVPHAAGGASATSLGVITRADGAQELSYAGHPLYYFIGDTKAGQQHGQGVDQFGAKWYVLDATGAAVVQQPSNPGNTGGGGYGY